MTSPKGKAEQQKKMIKNEVGEEGLREKNILTRKQQKNQFLF